jgi:MFS family permease
VQFLILEFVGGIGVAMWGTSSSVAMADFTTRENRGRLMAVRSITSRVGTLAGPLTGALILVMFHDNLRYVFLFNAVTKVFIHVLIQVFASETAPEENRRGAHGSGIERSKLDLHMFMTKAFAALVITSFAMHMMGQTGAYGALFPVQAKNEVGMSAAEVGQVLSIAGFIGLLMAYPSGWAIDKIGRKPMMIPGMLILAGAAFVLANLETTEQVYVMIVLYGIGNAMSLGGAQAFVIDLAPADRRGTYMGVWTLVGNTGGILAPLIIGAIATSLGYAPGYMVVVVMLIASAGIMLIWGPETGGSRGRAQVVEPATPAPGATGEAGNGAAAAAPAEGSRRIEV